MRNRLRWVPWWALASALAAGVGAAAIRAASERPHLIYVGIGVFGLVAAVTLAITAIDRSMH